VGGILNFQSGSKDQAILDVEKLTVIPGQRLSAGFGEEERL